MIESESEARNRSLEMNLDLSRFFDDVHYVIIGVCGGGASSTQPTTWSRIKAEFAE